MAGLGILNHFWSTVLSDSGIANKAVRDHKARVALTLMAKTGFNSVLPVLYVFIALCFREKLVITQLP